MSDAQMVVVGAGIVGVLTAVELRRRGHDVLVLERSNVAAGASGGPGKRGVRSGGRDPRELPLAARARSRWNELATITGSRLVETVGGLTVSDRPVDGSAGSWSLAAHTAVLRAHGIPAVELSRASLRDREPNLGTEATGAVYVSTDGVIDHTAATRLLAEWARSLGVEIVEAAEVTGVDASGRLTSPSGSVSASDAIVITANTSTGHLLRTVVGDVPLWPAAPQMNFVRPRTEVTLGHLVNHTRRPVAIKVGGGPGEVMISGGSRGVWDDELSAGIPDHGVAARALAEAAHVVPGLEDAEIISADASRGDSWSVDGVPVIDRATTAVPVFFAAGWSGHGYAIAPAVAAELAAWISTGARPPLLAPFGRRRLTGAGWTSS